MPKFPKSDGFSLGGNPFTMTKGSKEINTEGSFRQEAEGKMNSYGSPLFAIQAREGSTSLYDAPADGGRGGMAAAVDEGIADGGKIGAKLAKGEDGLEAAEESVGLDSDGQNAKESTIGGAEEATLETPEVDMGDDEEIEL